MVSFGLMAACRRLLTSSLFCFLPACRLPQCVFRVEEIEGNLITVQNCHIDVDRLSSVLLQHLPTQTINSPVRIGIQISACSSHN